MKKPKLKDLYEIKMKFPSREHALDFFAWMCDGGGEQSYWMIADYSPEEAEKLVTFDYFGDSEEFLGNDEVVCAPWGEWKDE